MKFAIHTTVVACLVWLAGCTSTPPPIQQMSDARLAIAAAVEAGADKHAETQLAEAKVSLRSAEANLQRQAYAAATRDAALAKRFAIEAREVAQARPDGPDRMREQPLK